MGQESSGTSGYVQAQYNQTLYDRTKGNNPWGMGLGAMVFRKASSSVRLMAELSTDYTFVDDKVLRLYQDGTPVPVVRGNISLYAGLAFRPVSRVAISFTAGPSLVSGGVFAGIRPSLLVYLSKNQKWVTRLAYTNIFNRDRRGGQDFGVVSAGVGVRVF